MERRHILLLAGATAVVAGGIFVWQGGLGPRPDAPDAGEAQGAPDHLAVSAAQIAALGIKLVPAAAADLAPIATLPAVVLPPPGARVAVTAEFAGIVVQTHVMEGESVKSGQALATIKSHDALAHVTELKHARARLRVAELNAKRLTQLNAEGVVSGARADLAAAELEEARADVAEKEHVLHIASADATGLYTLKAPIDGRVTKAAGQAGEPVEAMSAPYVVDAADRYAIEAQLPERLIGDVTPGMIVRLDDGATATVTSVGAVIDAETRSAVLKAALETPKGVVAGKTMTITLFGPAPAGAVSVPAAAVTTLSGADVAFVQAPDGFAIRPVTAAGSAGGQTIVLAGLKAGDAVAASSVSELKALALSQ